VSPERFDAMGVSVLVGGSMPAELAAVARLFEELEDMFSRFRPGSELNLVNAAPAEFVAVTPTFSRILALALDSARRTGGLVDPTLGAAIEAAGYDDDFTELADGSVLGPAVPGSWRQVRVAGRIVLRRPGTKLDLNCVVKGLAVDAALSLLSGDGFVAAGGDVAVRGNAVFGLPGGGSLTLSNGGLATSGTTRRRWVRGGELQHHLIDPRTGRPSTSRWSEVSVAAASCLEADVAAKAAFLLGDDGPAWLDERALPGRFLEGSETVVNDTWARSLAPARAA
jgi:thiamine biosynthesis lipoprotein